MKYIDFVVRNKHIESRHNSIIADNTDYMMRFAFDEGWEGYPDKTVLVLDNEGKIWELHLTGGATEVKLPKFIGRKLLAVGVTATAGDGEISTDAVSLRVDPSIRTGASEVIGSPESGAMDMLEEYREKYDTLIAELQAAIDSTYLGVTGAEVWQTVRITEVDEDGNPVAWEAVDFPEQIQTDFEQTDETAADYLKNRPFGNVAYDGIVFEKVFVFGGYNLVHVPGFDVLVNIQGSRQAEIRRGGNVVNTGSASVSVSDRDGSISIKYNSTAGTIIEFKGSNGYLSEINVQSNTDITSVSEYTLHIDGLYYEEYIKLSADKVEGTLPYAEASDYIPVSSGSGKSNYTAKALSSVIPILGVSGASVGQIVKIKSVDSSGKPTSWEAIDIPTEVFTINLTEDSDCNITADKTFAEIKAASDDGKVVDAKFADGIVPLLIVTDSEAIFAGTRANSSEVFTASLICTSDNVWSMLQDGFRITDGYSLGISGASVGQTVKIKAVDENGAPTEWEAGDAASGGSEWIKLGDVTVNQTAEFVPLSFESGIVTIDTNADGYASLPSSGSIGCIVHTIDVKSKTSPVVGMLKPKDYEAGTFEFYNRDNVFQSSAAYDPTTYKISIVNVAMVVLENIPTDYKRYKSRVTTPVYTNHGIRARYACDGFTEIGCGADSSANMGGGAIIETEFYPHPYDENYVYRRVRTAYGKFYGGGSGNEFQSFELISSGSGKTKPQESGEISFRVLNMIFVNGTRFELWGTNDD